MAIRNPMEWSVEHGRSWSHSLAAGSQAALRSSTPAAAEPAVRRIDAADLRGALAKGVEDFGACRTDVIFIALVYPVAGLVLAQVVAERDMMQLLLPLVAGFALVGPFAAVGLYEMSRRRELGIDVTWRDAFGVLRSPSAGAILALGLVLLALLALWLAAAQLIYMATVGPLAPASYGALLGDAVATPAGWAMMVAGLAVGMLFAVAVLAISVVSFPLMIDRRVGVATAVRTSLRAVALNPRPMALWGLIVAGSLAVAALPLLVGLVVVMPVLGHATWHLYRRVVDGGPTG